ncbi:MAG: cystathionine gamma-synthase [Phenylobacterium sp.]|jgi:cystathionine gamma-synthase
MTSFATSAVRSGIETDTQFGAVTPPLYLTSNYSFAGFNQPRQYDYARSGNPTRAGLENALAELEHGVGATVTASGMAAVSLPVQLLQPGDVLIAPHDCYGGTHRQFTALAKRGQFKVLWIDQSDEVALADAFSQNPKMLWIETPSNPLLRVVDVAKLSAKAKEVGCLTVVDNTFLSPAQQLPIKLGADIVVHSTTKYINGHSDVVGGAVVSNTTELATELAWWGNCMGITGSPFDCFMTMRGLRTLPVRIRQHQENTTEVVAFLEQSSAIKKVYYPGLETHPNHEIAKKQQTGFGAIVSFEVDENVCDIATFLESHKLFSLAESLGGVESLIAHPATMTHAAMPKEAQAVAGITGQLVRISVGIEFIDDLIADIEQAINASKLPAVKVAVKNAEELEYEPS